MKLVGDFRMLVFGVHFCTLFGLRSVCDLLVLRHFLAFEGGLAPVFKWVFDRTFHRVFTLVRVASQGGMYLVGVLHLSRARIYSPSRGGLPLREV
jgi:hypothetical protein